MNTKSDFDDGFLTKTREDEEERVLEEVAERSGLKFLPNKGVNLLDISSLPILERKEAERVGLVVFRDVSEKIDVASNNFEKEDVQKNVETLERKGYKVTKYLTTKKSMDTMLKFYDDIKVSTPKEAGLIDLYDESGVNLKTIDSVDKLAQAWKETERSIQKQKTTLFLRMAFACAINMGVSDVHIEPKKDGVLLRYRVDSVLVDVLTMRHQIFKLLTSRIKLLSGLKINIRNKAQDGRFSIQNTDCVRFDVRTSLIPGPDGESFVMRLLNPNKINLSLEDLGIENVLLNEFRKQIKRPNGMIIVTGPTGSGKTTTLYAFMKEIINSQIKIITLENPIEYKIEGVVQTQIEKDYSFADGLRALLRQDPDVILVGEIRDKEVASVSVNAALTGHIVFTTLHTNDAVGAIPRLTDLEIDSKIIPESVNIVIAQRLIRRLNEETKMKDTLTKQKEESLKKVYDTLPEEVKEKLPFDTNNIYKAEEETPENYSGIIGLYEAFVVDEKTEKAILEESLIDLKASVKGQGLISLKQDGVIKILKSITSVKEAERVLGVYE